jgi:hypothetical protein
MHPFIRTLLFCTIFAIGFGAMSMSILAGEFEVYYNNMRYKEYVDYQIRILQDKRVVYNDKLSLLYGDPQIRHRLSRAIFGVDPQKDDTLFPEPGTELMDESLSVVREIMGNKLNLTPKPQWVVTINKEPNRKLLLYGGIALIALSMFFFIDPAKDAPGQSDDQQPRESD